MSNNRGDEQLVKNLFTKFNFKNIFPTVVDDEDINQQAMESSSSSSSNDNYRILGRRIRLMANK